MDLTARTIQWLCILFMGLCMPAAAADTPTTAVSPVTATDDGAAPDMSFMDYSALGDCEDDFELINTWEAEHKAEAEKITAEAEDVIQEAMMGVGFSGALEPVTRLNTELLKRAGGDVACAEPISKFTIDMLETFLAMNASGEDGELAGFNEAMEDIAGLVGGMQGNGGMDLGECEDDNAAAELWANQHPEEIDALVAGFPDFETLLDAGDFEAAADIINQLNRAVLEAAGQDVACAEPITDALINIFMAFSTMGEAMADETADDTMFSFGDMGECMDDFEALQAWSDENAEQFAAIEAKHGNIDELLQAGDYDAAREMMLAAASEMLSVAGLDPTCNTPITDATLEMIKVFEAMGAEEFGETLGEDFGEKSPMMYPGYDLGDCQDDYDATEAWSVEHPEESEAIEARGEFIEDLLYAGKFDEAREPMMNLVREMLTAAGQGTACVEPITDYFIDMFMDYWDPTDSPDTANPEKDGSPEE